MATMAVALDRNLFFFGILQLLLIAKSSLLIIFWGSYEKRCLRNSNCFEIGIEKEETLQETAPRRKLRFFGHVMRSYGLEKGIMRSHGDGRRRKRGRPRRKWMDEIHEVTGMKPAELRGVTTERKQWRRLVKTVARTQRVDSTR